MNLQAIIEEIAVEVRPRFGKGRVADYIPALARIAPEHFGMAVHCVDGRTFAVGDARVPFSIQSISKVFALMIAIARVGDMLWTRVGKEPSGDPFNSLVLLEREDGFPRNPFINAGALAVLDVVLSNTSDAKTLLRDYVRVVSQSFDVDYDVEVARSELEHAHTNLALAHLMKSHGRIESPIEELIEVYCHQCALAMSCTQLAGAFLPLAARGRSPLLGEAVLTERQAKWINALMLTCGTYDKVGNFAFRVGLPAKSGVGGGIAAVVPGELTIVVWAPELDRSGNSYVGTAALELFTTITRQSIF